MQRTIVNLFESSVNKYPNNPLIWEKRDDKYISSSYIDIQSCIYKFAAGLMSLGFCQGERGALISEGRADWIVSELGILYAGGVNVPISVKIDSPTDLKFRLSHSNSRYVVVSKGQLHKLRSIKNDLPELETIIVLDILDVYEEDEISKEDLLERGELYLENKRLEFEGVWKNIKEEDVANICYTSGTTADPKGIMLTHRNYTANVEQASALLPIPEYYTSLLILPWDHAFAHTAGIYTLIANGASIASVQIGNSPLETLKNIPINIKEIKPHFLLSVPALAKNFRKGIENGIKEKGEKTEKLFRFALKIAYSYNKEGWNRGTGKEAFLKPLMIFFEKILFKKIRDSFGGRLEFFIGGGALLDIELQRFFYAIGIKMLQGYGLTEAAPIISANVPSQHKLGSSGKIVNNLEVRIVDEKGDDLPIDQKGEIVCRGENVMAGYWKNKKATFETLINGWLFTGDMGYIDNDGYLYVLGRYKSLLIANDGEKFSPEGIEEMITDNSPFIDQMMLYNNQSPYTIALVFPNKEAIKAQLKKEMVSIDTTDGQKRALMIIQEEINQYKAGGKFEGVFPERWLPSSIAVLGEGFTEQNKFLNSTLKMVRGKISDFYQSRLDYLFTNEAKDICNQQNLTIVSRWRG